MTVFAVCAYNIYEGTYAPHAIFSTREKAQEYIKTLKEPSDPHQDGYEVEEYELDVIPEEYSP